LKTQDSVFRDTVAKELNFPDDVIEPPREREPAHSITETRSRTYKKYGTTEIDYMIRLNRIMEIENAIKAVFAHAKKKLTTKKATLL